MPKYFEVDFRKGSFNDTMGRTVTVTGSPEIKRGEKGNYIASLNSSKYLTYSSQILPNNAFTLVVFIKHKYSLTAGTRDKIIAGSSSIAFHTKVSSTKTAYLLLATNNAREWNCVLDNNWHCWILTMPGSAQADISNSYLYDNGIQQSVSATYSSDAPGSRSSITNIGLSGDAISQMNIAYLATYDHVFTEAERNKAYQDFLNSYPTVSEKFPQQSIINKPLSLTHLKDAGLVAAYNMIPNGNVLTDISGNGISQMLYNCPVIEKQGLRFNSRRNQYAFKPSIPNTTFNPYGNVTIAIRLYNYTWGGENESLLMSYGNMYFGHVSSGGYKSIRFTKDGFAHATQSGTNSTQLNTFIDYVVTSASDGTSNIYINGVLSGTANQNAGTSSPAINYDFYIGRLSSSSLRYLDATIQDFRIYNRILSLSEIKAYHNSFVNTYLKEDFSDCPADNIVF